MRSAIRNKGEEANPDRGGTRRDAGLQAQRGEILDDAEARRHEQDAQHGEQAVRYLIKANPSMKALMAAPFSTFIAPAKNRTEVRINRLF